MTERVADVIPLVRGAVRKLDKLDRSELGVVYEQYRTASNEWLRRMVVENNRIDILAKVILKYEVEPFHLAMMVWQFNHPRSLVLAYRGSGKCLAPGTLVLKADGTAVPVEQICVGDLLMGPDSRPRTVLGLGHGTGRLLRVTPIKGDSWICNDEHILTLKGRGHFYGGRIRDVPIRDVIEQGARNKRGTADLAWKLFRVPLYFSGRPTPIDPYLFGLWLGDGSTNESQIWSADVEVQEWLFEFANREGYKLTRIASYTVDRFDLGRGKGVPNPIRRYLRSLGTKCIPSEFLINSERVRLPLLAGLIDTDGYYNPCGGYEISQKNEELSKQIAFLARSLGFGVSLSKKISTIKSTGFSGEYFRVNISGDLDRIPCRIKRKKARKRTSAKDVLVTGFSIEEAGYGDYFGFELDGDGRFLLGDLTVTHNTTICTVVKAIHYLCKNRDLRILIASESKKHASDILTEIKGHFENNERLAEVFGPFYDPRTVGKWDTNAIEVCGRSFTPKEPTIMCAGPDTAITGKHYEIGLPDDLVTEDNARTSTMRERIHTWYYKTYRPMILPAKADVEHRGEQHHSGTRYHFADHYGHLQENELKEHTLVIPAFDEHGNVPWPNEHPPEHFEEVRTESGIIIFNSQYQNDTEAMKGEIFEYDHCQELDDDDFPKIEDLMVFLGGDLACDEEERKKNAMFAICVLGLKGSIAKDDLWIYVIDFYLSHLRPTKQPDKVLEFYDLYKPLRSGIETNQYQVYLAAHIKQERPQMVIRKIQTKLDKNTRAWKRAKYFENGRVFFRKGIQARAIDALVGLPGSGKWDFFDSFDFALSAAMKRGKKKKKRSSFGLL